MLFPAPAIRIIAGTFGVIGAASGLFQKAAPTVTYADVEPIFRAHCISCHSTASPSGGLALDTYAAATKNKALLAKEGTLLHRVLGEGGLPRMPMGFAPLSAEQIRTLKEWTERGTPDAPKEKAVHWAFVAPKRPKLPKVKLSSWTKNPVDSFVLAEIERAGLKPSPMADKTTLLRRVTLDLTGLLPTSLELEAFLNDKSPPAYERVVDRLLASPHYGERMALPWLDAARYADSNGFQQDGDTYQYVWRDWVVKALNDNMPFSDFTVQQLAGDLLPYASTATEKGRSALIATGFNRNHMLNGEGGAIAEEQRNVVLFDRVDTTSTAWLGLTMGCARCHDHKYDPVNQKDYFRMMAFFNQVPEVGVPSGGGQYRLDKPWVFAGSQKEMERLAELNVRVPKAEAGVQQMLAKVRPSYEKWLASPTVETPEEIRSLLKASRNGDQERQVREFYVTQILGGSEAKQLNETKSLRAELDRLRQDLPKVMIMSDRQKRDTFLYNRGNYEEPLEKVTPGTPDFLPKLKGSNRLALAKWVVSPENPLTARVQVNRYWQLFFGKGLVDTPENFGTQGSRATHPELLDWLACEFMSSGWNVKRLHRLIVTSATYKQSSKITPPLRQHDPANRLLARGARFRLPSMIIRDTALQAAGLLNPKMGGKPVYPYQPTGIWDGLSITKERDFTYPQSKGADLYRRSIYTFWRRTAAPGNMFDSSSRQVCTVRPSQTSTPLHALTTLNDVTWVEAARGLAQRVMLSQSTPERRVTEAFKIVCCRAPKADELAVLRRGLERAVQEFTKAPNRADQLLAQGELPTSTKLNRIQLAAYATTCLTILNLDEALTRE